MDWRALDQFSFGDNPKLADELAALVLEGKKTATCWAASHGLLTEVGKRMVMLDGSGRPRAVIETVELTQRRFPEVDEAFAYDEGEGDRTLAYWREAHAVYFSRLGQLGRGLPPICYAIAGTRQETDRTRTCLRNCSAAPTADAVVAGRIEANAASFVLWEHA